MTAPIISSTPSDEPLLPELELERLELELERLELPPLLWTKKSAARNVCGWFTLRL
jgi:hypothetical protein